jgi:hypothetical protein
MSTHEVFSNTLYAKHLVVISYVYLRVPKLEENFLLNTHIFNKSYSYLEFCLLGKND